MNRVPWRQLWRQVALLPGQSALQRFLMLVHDLSHDVAKGQPSRGSGENSPQDRGRGDSLYSGPTIGLAAGRSHTFSVRIIQCEIGTRIVARIALHREEGKVFQ